MNKLKPAYFVKSVGDMPDDLPQFIPGIEGVTLDLDKTLVSQSDKYIRNRHKAKLKAWGEAGLSLALISNARSPERARRVQTMARSIGELLGQECPAVLLADTQSFRPKPNPSLFYETARRLNIPPSRLMHVGDQMYRDVFGANRAGYGATVLVAPYGASQDDDTGVRFIMRPLESAIRPAFGMPRSTDSFPSQLQSVS